MIMKQTKGNRTRRRSRGEVAYSPFDNHSHDQSASGSSSRNGSVAMPVNQGDFPKAALFAFDIPEHLPSSPICPAHPKNKSGGKGVCVYHGRRKSVAVLESEGGPSTL
ncbi:hypothetical protein V8F20_010049 [Naviculisporaceae sp. PSN 640]